MKVWNRKGSQQMSELFVIEGEAESWQEALQFDSRQTAGRKAA